MATVERVDAVVIGGGIAGSALAAVLAGDGYDVLLLERQTVYRDKVRGEVINCWGVVELLELGLEKQLLDAGGTYIDRFVGFDEITDPETAWANALNLDDMLPGIRGVLDVGHPEACEALATAAAEAGATVVRGIGDVVVTGGPQPSVRYEYNDVEYEVPCRLVVGADGRTSTVRRQLGISLTQTPPNSLGGGMLVEDLHDWPANVTSIGTEKDLLYFVFPVREPRPGCTCCTTSPRRDASPARPGRPTSSRRSNWTASPTARCSPRSPPRSPAPSTR